jgi:hypothetical protein
VSVTWLADAEGMRLTRRLRLPMAVALVGLGLIAGVGGFAAGASGGTGDDGGAALPALTTQAVVQAIPNLGAASALPQRPATAPQPPVAVAPVAVPPPAVAPPASVPPPAPPPVPPTVQGIQ